MRFLKTTLGLISLLIIVTSLNSCQHKYAVETASIDSLIVKNKKALTYLQIDIVTINERKNEMKKQVEILQKFKPDSSGTEFFLNFEKYKGILKIYSRFIENYEAIFNRVRQNEKQLSALKNSVMDDKITGTEFKTAFEKEAFSVNDNLANAEVFGNRIFQLEPDYQRLSDYFDPQVKAMIKQYPELKSLLDSSSQKP